jgi:putative peptidoglycan lipid II flippase
MTWRERFTKQGVRDASILIAVFTVLSQLIGLVREAVLAHLFGTSAEYDLLLLAVAIPGMVGSMLMVAIPSAGIPHLQGVTLKSGYRLLASPFIITNAMLTALAAVFVWFALPALSSILATGITSEQLNTVVGWGRIACVVIILRGFESTFRALQHRESHFLTSSLTPFAYNFVLILTLVTLYPQMGAPVYLLGITLALGTQSLLLAGASIVLSRHQEADGRKKFNAGAYSTYFILVFGIEALILLLEPIDRMLAGRFLSGGYVSAVNYATVLYSVPIRVIIASVATAIFPLFSHEAAKDDIPRIARMYHRSLAACLLLVVPLSVFGWAFRYELIALLLERGRFDADSTRITAELGAWLFLTVPIIAASTFQWRVLYALRDWKWFAVTRVISLAVKIGLGVVFIQSDWALALGGGTLALYAVSFFMLEQHLLSRYQANYTSADFAQLRVASVVGFGSAGICLLGAWATNTMQISEITGMIVTGTVCTAIVFFCEKKYRVIGLLGKK